MTPRSSYSRTPERSSSVHGISSDVTSDVTNDVTIDVTEQDMFTHNSPANRGGSLYNRKCEDGSSNFSKTLNIAGSGHTDQVENLKTFNFSSALSTSKQRHVSSLSSSKDSHRHVLSFSSSKDSSHKHVSSLSPSKDCQKKEHF